MKGCFYVENPLILLLEQAAPVRGLVYVGFQYYSSADVSGAYFYLVRGSENFQCLAGGGFGCRNCLLVSPEIVCAVFGGLGGYCGFGAFVSGSIEVGNFSLFSSDGRDFLGAGVSPGDCFPVRESSAFDGDGGVCGEEFGFDFGGAGDWKYGEEEVSHNSISQRKLIATDLNCYFYL